MPPSPLDRLLKPSGLIEMLTNELGLAQAEALSLGLLQEADELHCVRAIRSVAGVAAWWPRQEPPPLVIAESLDIHSGLFGDLASSHPWSVNPVSRYKVKPKRLFP